MLTDLRQERDQIGEAITVMERLAAGSRKRRGCPPAYMTAVKDKPKRRAVHRAARIKTEKDRGAGKRVY